MTENELQKQILSYLSRRGIFAYRNNVFKGKSSGGGYVQTGIKGLADIAGVLPDGTALFIEVKLPKGKQSKEQIEFEEKVKSLNGVYVLARSVNEVSEALRELPDD